MGKEDTIAAQFLPTLVPGVGSAMTFIAARYKLFKPRINKMTLYNAEDTRMKPSIESHLLYGQIAEWFLVILGIMTLMV